jgi:hypothetical protein
MMLSYAFANPGTIVKANRRLRHPIVRRIGSVLYNVECRILFSLAVWDVNGTPKIFDRGVAEAFELQENGDLIDLEFVVKARVHDRPILEVPVVSAYRHGGRSTTNFGSAFTMYRGALRLWREYRRMLPSADRIARS